MDAPEIEGATEGIGDLFWEIDMLEGWIMEERRTEEGCSISKDNSRIDNRTPGPDYQNGYSRAIIVAYEYCECFGKLISVSSCTLSALELSRHGRSSSLFATCAIHAVVKMIPKPSFKQTLPLSWQPEAMTL